MLCEECVRSARARRDVAEEADQPTPLLGRFMLGATWENVREHATGLPDYWGSRGRGFKSRRPDEVKFQQLSARCAAGTSDCYGQVASRVMLLDTFTRVVLVSPSMPLGRLFRTQMPR